ncbi:MAG: hypothetical protein ACN4GW_10775 [Desulforhopalus sp.]
MGRTWVQFAKLLETFFPQPVWFLIVDDILIYRSARKEPGIGIYHQHVENSNCLPWSITGECT